MPKKQKLNRYPIRITREASYVEAVDAIIVAASEEEAEEIAIKLGNGDQPNWPEIDMYNTAWREPLEHALLEIEHGL